GGARGGPRLSGGGRRRAGVVRGGGGGAGVRRGGAGALNPPRQRGVMGLALAAAALVLAGCAHCAGLRYTLTPCNARFQNTVAACFPEAGGALGAFSYGSYPGARAIPDP